MSATDEAIAKLTVAMETAIKSIGTLGEKYGPEVIDSALWVVRLGGIADIASNIVGAAVSGALAALCWRAMSSHRAAVKKREGNSFDFYDMAPEIVVPCAFGLVSGVIISLICIGSAANVWPWVAIFDPKLWIAKRLLGL